MDMDSWILTGTLTHIDGRTSSWQTYQYWTACQVVPTFVGGQMQFVLVNEVKYSVGVWGRRIREILCSY